MHEGRLVQVATPRTSTAARSNAYVASFLGEANLLPVSDGARSSTTRRGQIVDATAVLRPET